MKTIISFLLFHSCFLFCQVTKQWEHSYQYINMNWGNGVDLIINNLNEPVVLGQQWGWEQTPLLHIYKLNPLTGTVIWDQSPSIAAGEYIFCDSLNNIFVCGRIKNGWDWTVPFLTKYNNSGNQIFYKTDPTDQNGPLYSADFDVIGNTFLLKKYLSWIKTSKYDSSGNIQWTNYEARTDTFSPGKISYNPLNKETVSNGYYIKNNRYNIYFLKIDSSGNTSDTASLLLSSISEIINHNLKVLNNNQYIISGKYKNISNVDYAFICKLNSSFDTVWCNKITTNQSLAFSSIYIQNNGSIITNNTSGLLKYDSLGNILWSTSFGTYNKIITGNDNFIYSCGKTSDNKFLTSKYDQSGNEIWSVIENFTSFISNNLRSVKLDTSYNIYVHGSSNSSPASGIFTIKYSQITKINNISGILPVKQELFQNYPNPFNPATNIKFALYKNTDAALLIFDIKGSLLTTINFYGLKPGVYSYKWYAGNYSSGIYFVKLATKYGNQTRKISLIK